MLNTQKLAQNNHLLIFLVVFVVTVSIFLIATLVAGPDASSFQAESAQLTNGTVLTDNDASEGKYVSFSSQPDPGGSGEFFDDFVDPNWEARYDFDVFHRDPFVVAVEEWQGDHASLSGGNDPDNCTNPFSTRTVTRGDEPEFNDEWIYRCTPGDDVGKAHIMTSIGDTSGYSIGAFSPKQTFNNVTEVRWDVNATDLGTRQWVEVAIVPANAFDFQNLPCKDWLPCDSTTYDAIGAIGVGWSGNASEVATLLSPDFPGGDQWDRFDQENRPCSVTSPGFCFGAGWDDSDPARDSVVIRRTNILRDNGDGSLTWSLEQEDGSFLDLIHPTSFPEGPVRVVFKDHNYTPDKDGIPISHTWHWDNILVK